jgi:hypothetical protein
LPQTEKHSRVGAKVAEPEAAGCVEPEIDEAEHAIWQAAFQPLVKWQKDKEQREAEDHLVDHLGVHDHAGLPEGARVDVLDAPWQRGRRPVMFPVDDISNAADGEADHGCWTTRIYDLPVRKLGAPRPYVSPHRRPKQASPLTDTAFGQCEHA